MEGTLLTVGLVCLVAAVVGGGLKILGNELPVLQSGRRQAALGVLGAALVLGAFWSRLPVPSRPPAEADAAKPLPSNSPSPAAGDAANLTPAQAASQLRRPDGQPFRNATQEAQYMLNALGMDAGPPDGLEGQKTTVALEAFQRAHGLPTSGTADTATVAILRARAGKAFLRRNGDAARE